MPVAAQNGDGRRQYELRNEDLDHEHVHLLLNIALLITSQLRVHHYTGLLSSIYDKADDPFCVLKLRALEKQLLLCEREEFLPDVHFSIERV